MIPVQENLYRVEKSHEEETRTFIDEILPSINIPLLKEVVKLGHQFGYIFPEEVVIRCK